MNYADPSMNPVPAEFDLKEFREQCQKRLTETEANLYDAQRTVDALTTLRYGLQAALEATHGKLEIANGVSGGSGLAKVSVSR